ncbi:MAG: DUF72 domain-containing protein [Candidatus Eremiobacteraeota bacterium]|nr:DUF72 domain-containing protein [Candidatus Eremiobacteraeota bacterium]
MNRIGTAGWSIPAELRPHFPVQGTLLQRYASQLDCVEINSSFYRPHRPGTYARWAASVPADFAFSLKIPKAITHERRCAECHGELARFLRDCANLETKRAVLLVQLPPSLAYNDVTMDRFFRLLRSLYGNGAVCEPRHPSWFTNEADDMLAAHRVGRVAADPAISEMAAVPGGWPGIAYYRLHGSPRRYYSKYEPSVITSLATQLQEQIAPERWVIFDNTASGAALANAIELSSHDQSKTI